MLARAIIDTPIGSLGLEATDRGLAAVQFDPDPAFAEGAPSPGALPMLEHARRELDEYFAGRLMAFTVPLALRATIFRRRVYDQLLVIPFGATTTYGAIAKALKDPNATRAVGLANGRNPIPIVVPCHRVIGADGALTGFGGGLPRKRWLLDHEQTVLIRAGLGTVVTGRREGALPFAGLAT